MHQSDKWQEETLAAALKSDTWQDLYWGVTVKLPLNEAPGRTPMERAKRRFRSVSVGGYVPVIKIGREPDITREWAWMLAGLIEVADRRAGASRLREYGIDIITLSVLESDVPGRWFVFGEQMTDVVCPYCGGIVGPQNCLCTEWKLPRPWDEIPITQALPQLSVPQDTGHTATPKKKRGDRKRSKKR